MGVLLLLGDRRLVLGVSPEIDLLLQFIRLDPEIVEFGLRPQSLQSCSWIATVQRFLNCTFTNLLDGQVGSFLCFLCRNAMMM